MTIRRLRAPAAILGLLATSLFIGEGLRASMCAPMTLEGRTTAATPAGDGAADDIDCAPTPGGETDDDRGSDCPFTGIATSAGCVSAALGTESAQLLPDGPRTMDPVASVDSHPDLLLETYLFRPPRA